MTVPYCPRCDTFHCAEACPSLIEIKRTPDVLPRKCTARQARAIAARIGRETDAPTWVEKVVTIHTARAARAALDADLREMSCQTGADLRQSGTGLGRA